MEKINLDGQKLAEAIHGNMTAQDVNDTANEMWKCREEVNGYMKDLTLDEMKEMCGIVKEWYNS